MKFKLLSLLLIAALLVACSVGGPTPLPTVGLPNATAAPQSGSGGGGVIASGKVVPGQEASLAFALAGEIEKVNVGVGDQVQAGDVLASLAGSEQLTAAVDAAQLAVLNAQQALKTLQDSAAVETARAQLAVAQAQAAVAAAQKNVDDEQRRFQNLKTPDLDWYQEQVDKAHDALLTAQENTELIDIGSLQAALQATQDLRDKLKERLDKVQAAVSACSACDPAGSFTVDGFPQTLADAQDNYNGAVNRIKELELQIAQAKRGSSQAIVDAQQAYDDAVRNLEAAQHGPKPLDVQIADANLAVAQANLAMAQANLSDAQTHYEAVKNGPDPDQLALAQARLAAAESQLAAAQSAAANTELRAPFNGTVTDLNLQVGSWVTPGLPVLSLSDLQQMRVETTDLSERDIPKIEIGQPVTVFVKVLNQEAAGHVSTIAPLADTLGGDVIYKTTIVLETLPPGLRAGMSVTVEFAAGQ
jgi:multidrug resistance efflux pump